MKPRLAVCTLVIAAGIFLRLHQIGYNFDGDELFSVQAANDSFPHLLATAIKDRTHPPLHLFLLFLWIKVWGSSEASVRTLSVLASVFFLICTYRLAVRWMREPAALWVLGICSLSPFFVYYGQQARPYSLVALFASLSALLMCKSQEEPQRKVWRASYGLACASLMYTQYLGALILLPQFAVLAFPKSPEKRRTLLFGLLGMMSILVWVLLLGRDLQPERLARENIGWIPRPSALGLAFLYVGIFGWLPMQGSARILLLLTVVILSGFVLKPKSTDWGKVFFLGFLGLLQPVFVFFFSRFGPVSIWAPRQLIGSQIFLMCLIGLALELHRKWVAVAAGLALVVWCVLGLPGAFPAYAKPPWRYVASQVEGVCAGCDVVTTEPWISRPLSHYAKKEIHSFPDYANQVGHAGRVVLLCRPFRCEARNDFSPRYNQIERRRITWSWLPPSSTEMIDLYVLERKREPAGL